VGIGKKWKAGTGKGIWLEIPNLSRHDYKEKIRRFWIQDSGVLKRKRSGIGGKSWRSKVRET